jgi:hypothetical protein
MAGPGNVVTSRVPHPSEQRTQKRQSVATAFALVGLALVVILSACAAGYLFYRGR